MKSKVHSSTQYMNLKMIWILSSTFENGNAKMMKSKEKKMTTLTPTMKMTKKYKKNLKVNNHSH